MTVRVLECVYMNAYACPDMKEKRRIRYEIRTLALAVQNEEETAKRGSTQPYFVLT